MVGGKAVVEAAAVVGVAVAESAGAVVAVALVVAVPAELSLLLSAADGACCQERECSYDSGHWCHLLPLVFRGSPGPAGARSTPTASRSICGRMTLIGHPSADG